MDFHFILKPKYNLSLISTFYYYVSTRSTRIEPAAATPDLRPLYELYILPAMHTHSIEICIE